MLLLPPETNGRHVAAATTTAVSGVCDAATASRCRSRGGEIKEARGDVHTCTYETESNKVVLRIFARLRVQLRRADLQGGIKAHSLKSKLEI